MCVCVLVGGIGEVWQKPGIESGGAWDPASIK